MIYRQIPSPGTRRALLEKGDVDVSVGLPPKDYAELAALGTLQVIGTPVQNDLLFIDMNVQMKPFDNPKVRQAMAYAIPYDSVMKAALYGRAVPMFGADAATPYAPTWPVPSHYTYDLAKAKQLLAEAGYPERLQDHDLLRPERGDDARANRAVRARGAGQDRGRGGDREGARCELVRADGVEVDAFRDHRVLWLAGDTPEYFYFWNFYGKNNAVFNTANYVNPKLDAVIDAARFQDDTAKYDADLVEMNDIVMGDLPRIPLCRVTFDVATQPNVKGYVYWFHTHLDYRTLYKD